MRSKRLVRNIQEILVRYTPIEMWAQLRDTTWVPRQEIHRTEAEEIARLLSGSQDINQLQEGIYNSFVQHNEYAYDWEKAKEQLDGGKPATLEHVAPGFAGKLEDYTTIAQEVFALAR